MKVIKITDLLRLLIVNAKTHTLFAVLFVNLFALMATFFISDLFLNFMPRESFHVAHAVYDARSVNLLESMPRELNVSTQTHAVNEIDIQFNMRMFSLGGHDNAFQTADGNSGVRLEFEPVSSRMAIVVGSRRDHSVFMVPSVVDVERDYRVRIKLYKNQIQCFIDDQEVLNKYDSSLAYSVSKLLVGTGYSQSRPFSGKITDFTMSYGTVFEPLWLKIFKKCLLVALALNVVLVFVRYKILMRMKYHYIKYNEKHGAYSNEHVSVWYQSTIMNFLKDARYSIPMLLSAAIGFSFAMTHLSIGADDTCVDRYFDGEYLLAQNRVTGYLVNRVLQVYAVKPFVPDFMCVLLLIVSSLVFSAVFKRVSNDRLHPLTYTFFTCIFISYPLIFQIFIIMGANLNICIGYALASLSIVFAVEFLNTKRGINLLISSVILYFALSCYESFASVYLCAFSAVLVLKYLFGDDEDKNIGKVLVNGIALFIPLVIALIIYKVVGSVLASYIQLPNYAATGIAWESQTQTFHEIFTGLWKGVVLKFIYSGLIFQPITSLVIAIFCGLALSIFYLIKYRKFAIVLIVFAMLLSVVSLSLLQGYATFYRSCQVFAFFTAFLLGLTLHEILQSSSRKFIKNTAVVLMTILVFRQANDLNNWFYVDYMRSEEERAMANLIAHQVKSEFGVYKPVIFTGGNGISENINSHLVIKPHTWNGKLFNSIASRMMGYDMSGYKFVESDMVPIYGWAIGAFGEVNTELLKYFKMNGHTFRQGTMEMFIEAIEISKYKPVWPAKGAIFETPTYIVVHL